MKKIHKYELQICDKQELQLSEAFNVLALQVQYGKPTIWVEEYSDDLKVKVEISTIPTGGEVPQFGWHIGTYQLHEGRVVFHVYADVSYE